MLNPVNRLAQETSPYLKQHADNPVHWQPWDEIALETARELNRPILLSIGYSACHWCHVMAHESFEDSATAELMNDLFVNIKVDREERPDLDKIYQTAHQLLTQQGGGWPLTIFLDPHTLLPFFAGTYFPKTPRYQLPGFKDLLQRVAHAFREQHDELAEQSGRLATVMQQLNPAGGEGAEVSDQDLLNGARDALASQYDEKDGGFGHAPKFPMPMTLDRLLRHWYYSNRSDRQALEMSMTTLTQMARGGIYDHLGGGFCRYATDQRWMIPHFEKMLYDNGSLLSTYSDAMGISSDELFKETLKGTGEWLIQDMQHEQGGYYAARDADSEGEEGKYYVWRRDEVKKLLTEQEYDVISTLYGLDKPANFEGRWNLHRYDAWLSVVARLGLERQPAEEWLASAKAKLLAARNKRIAPGLDDKILTGWNGLAIKGMTRAGLRLSNASFIESAARAVDFLRQNVWLADQDKPEKDTPEKHHLYATWNDGKAKYRAYLDDYANLLAGLLELLTARWRGSDIIFARQLADQVIEDFYDDDRGGFFFTGRDHESLIQRPKPTNDEATPPGNGVLADALNRLGHLLGETRYLEVAERTLAWARGAMAQYPAGHCTLLHGLEAALHPASMIIIRGPSTQLEDWTRPLRVGFHPDREVYAIPYEDPGLVPAYLPKLVSADQQNKLVAYVCTGLSCSLPITEFAALQKLLSSGEVV